MHPSLLPVATRAMMYIIENYPILRKTQKTKPVPIVLFIKANMRAAHMLTHFEQYLRLAGHSGLLYLLHEMYTDINAHQWLS